MEGLKISDGWFRQIEYMAAIDALTFWLGYESLWGRSILITEKERAEWRV